MATGAKLPSRRRGSVTVRRADSGRILPTHDALQLVKMVRAGVPYRQMVQFQKASALSWEKIARLVHIPLRTLARRQQEGRLRPEESDRLVRAGRVFQQAVDLFEGDVEGARHWLQMPQSSLGGESPLEMASTEVGAREVENLILRLEHGVFS